MADKKEFSRREFLKRLGISSASAAALLALNPLSIFADDKNKNDDPVAAAEGMTYRIHRKSKEKVSLLGYGMMRLPRKNRRIDQELVNKQVKYALEHGVNYFDTSPHYVNNQSERALGIALKASGFDRKSFYVATKMSNFGQDEWSYEKSVELYQNSFKELQVDYIDYYLLHGIGMGGLENFNHRFIENGILEFKDNIVTIVAQGAFIGRTEENVRENLEKIKNQRLEANRKEQVDFASKERELIREIKKANAGDL